MHALHPLHVSLLAVEVVVIILQHRTEHQDVRATERAVATTDKSKRVGSNSSSSKMGSSSSNSARALCSSSSSRIAYGRGRANDFDPAWWLVVIGRAFIVVGKAIKQADSCTCADAAGKVVTAISHPQHVLRRLSVLVTWLGSDLQLVPDTVPEQKQQLLHQQQEVQASVEQAVCALEVDVVRSTGTWLARGIATWLCTAGKARTGFAAQLKCSQLAEKLAALGEGLCVVLPVPLCCNNPNCANCSDRSELQLVAGRGCRCGQCHTARFCGRECQVEWWPSHKLVCKALRASHSH